MKGFKLEALIYTMIAVVAGIWVYNEFIKTGEVEE